MVQNKGTDVPMTAAEIRREYAPTISRALNFELGQSGRAAKTIMKWTGASERAAKYWLSGSRGPNGSQLILLVRNSEAVLQEFLRLAGRDLFKVSIELGAAEASLARATAIVRALRADPNFNGQI
jgi:hypothetical protein